MEEYTRRDYLAQDRTHLANERTLLSYWRTALAFLASGAFLIKFFISTRLIVLALISILFGIALSAYGTIRYVKLRKKIHGR